MHPRHNNRLRLLGLLSASGSAVALAAACSTTPPGAGNTAGTNATTSGAAGVATGGAAGVAATGGSAGVGVTGGAAGAGGGQPPVGGAGGSGATVAPACKAVTQVNGSGLTVSAMDVNAFRYAPGPANDMTKMAYDPIGKVVVVLGANGNMYSFDPNVALPTAAGNGAITAAMPYNSGHTADAGYGTGIFAPFRGLAFDGLGNLYVMAARGGGNSGVSIRKGAVPATPGGARTWTTIVSTSMGYPASGTDYDHSFSGIAINAANDAMFISSGSRTEHGETRGAAREVPMTSAIFKFPLTGTVDLKNDDASLAPYLFADGVRNVFDLAFNAEGDLIGTENGPDIDLPDEVNFLEQGKHYGFPWRFGDVDNPTRDAAYSPQGDARLNPGFGAVSSGTYVADAGFPAPPGAFTDPIKNMGPDANYMRAGRDAQTPAKAGAEGLAGVSGHRSPLGLAFDVEGKSCGRYWKAGFMLSYGALVSTLNDEGRDLVLLNMTKANGAYTMTATQIAKGLSGPMDSVLVGNRLFAITFGDGAQIYVFELPTP